MFLDHRRFLYSADESLPQQQLGSDNFPLIFALEFNDRRVDFLPEGEVSPSKGRPDDWQGSFHVNILCKLRRCSVSDPASCGGFRLQKKDVGVSQEGS